MDRILSIYGILDDSLNSIDKHIDGNIQTLARIRFMEFIILNFSHLFNYQFHMFISSDIFNIVIIISCLPSIIIGGKVIFVVSKTLTRFDFPNADSSGLRITNNLSRTPCSGTTWNNDSSRRPESGNHGPKYFLRRISVINISILFL